MSHYSDSPLIYDKSAANTCRTSLTITINPLRGSRELLIRLMLLI